MAKYNNQRFYWIKLSEEFMNGDIVKFFLRQKGGSDYIVIYQLLCLKTVNKDGCLADFVGELIIPFNEESIQQELQYFSLDTIRVALSLYKKLGLIYEESDGVLRIAEFNSLVGSQTISAAKKQIQRVKDGKKQLENKGGQDGGQKGGQMSTERLDIDIEVSHISPACAHEEEGKKELVYGLKEFLAAYPNIKNDVPGIGFELESIDWQAVAEAFKVSEWLKTVDSLYWIIRNLEKILSGKYRTFKGSRDKTQHFENERDYTSGELNSLLKNVDDIDF